MTGSVRLCLVTLAVALLPQYAVAQVSAKTPRISIVQRGADRLLEDTQHMMSLSAEGREQWEVVKEFFEEIFLLGVDRTQPIRIDMNVGNGPTRYVPSFPIVDEGDFRANLEGFGIDSRKKGPGYFELRDAFEGWMRVKDGYASIAETEVEIPKTMPGPKEAISNIVEADFDLGFELANSETSAKAREARREAFRKDVIDNLMAGVNRRDKESKEDYELRRLGVEQQLEEIQRYYSDTAAATIGWSADVTDSTATVDVRLEAIPESDLAAAIQLLNAGPSRFANVPREESSILSVRVNHPIDPLRQKHFVDFYNLLAPALKTRVDANGGTSEPEKTARKQVIQAVVDLLAAGANAGIADGFGEVVPDGGNHTIVAAMASPNGKAADGIVALLPKANGKVSVQTRANPVGDVTVHEITIPIADLPGLNFLVGDSNVLLVGTSQNAVWFAAGPGASDRLAAAIDAVAAPNTGDPNAPFLDLLVHLRPWLEVRDRSAANDGGDPELRKIVMEAIAAGDDSLTLQLQRVEDHVEGRMGIGEGLIRVVGRLMAKFSKENLQ